MSTEGVNLWADAGRPRVIIDLRIVERAASIGCTMNEIATLSGVGRSTFFSRYESDPDVKDAVEKGRDTGAATLRRMQWGRAEAGSDHMLIWLGKQLLGQKENTTVAHAGPDGTGPIQSVSVVTNDPVEAAKIYQKMMTED